MKWSYFVVCFLFFPCIAIAQTASTTLETAFAYIAFDGNVYLTDGSATVQITDDAFVNDFDTGVRYTHPVWSRDGSALAFMRLEGLERSIMVVRSGEAPQAIVTREDRYITQTSEMLDFSPDGSQIAFFSSEGGEQAGIFILDLRDGTVAFLARAIGGCIGEAGGEDPAEQLNLSITGRSRYGAQYTLRWVDAGTVFSPGTDLCGGGALITADGERVWEGAYFDMLFSGDGSHMIARDIETGTRVIVDTASGEATPFDLPDDADPIGWAYDHVLYRTRVVTYSTQGNATLDSGREIYGEIWGFFRVETANLTLWADALDGSDSIEIYQMQGYDIAEAYAVGEDRLLITYTSSNLPATLALNEGASAEEARPIQAQFRSVVVQADFETGIVGGWLSQFDGGYVAYNDQPFVVP